MIVSQALKFNVFLGVANTKCSDHICCNNEIMLMSDDGLHTFKAWPKDYVKQAIPHGHGGIWVLPVVMATQKQSQTQTLAQTHVYSRRPSWSACPIAA